MCVFPLLGAGVCVCIFILLKKSEEGSCTLPAVIIVIIGLTHMRTRTHTHLHRRMDAQTCTHTHARTLTSEPLEAEQRTRALQVNYDESDDESRPCVRSHIRRMDGRLDEKKCHCLLTHIQSPLDSSHHICHNGRGQTNKQFDY